MSSSPASTTIMCSRMARANPVSSAAVSPFILIAISKARDLRRGRVAFEQSAHGLPARLRRKDVRPRRRDGERKGTNDMLYWRILQLIAIAQQIMKIHEYQAKALLARYDVPVPAARWRSPSDEAEAAAKKLGGSVVVKAQIHAGGRGKGGGVKVAKDAAEAREIAEKILGMTLVTHQTGPEGRVVQRLLIEETLPIERELYLGIVLDRAHRQERLHGVGGRRHGDRRGRRARRRSAFSRSRSSRASACCRFRRASWRSASALPVRR